MVDAIDPALAVLVVVIALGLAFDFVNGFHDTANAIATSVATRVLSPGRAVAMAAILNVVGALSGTAVASTASAVLGRRLVCMDHPLGSGRTVGRRERHGY